MSWLLGGSKKLGQHASDGEFLISDLRLERNTHYNIKEKMVVEDEMVGGHHRFNGCELGWTPGDGERQGGLASCSPRGRKSVRHS